MSTEGSNPFQLPHELGDKDSNWFQPEPSLSEIYIKDFKYLSFYP